MTNGTGTLPLSKQKTCQSRFLPPHFQKGGPKEARDQPEDKKDGWRQGGEVGHQ